MLSYGMALSVDIIEDFLISLTWWADLGFSICPPIKLQEYELFENQNYLYERFNEDFNVLSENEIELSLHLMIMTCRYS